MSAWPGFVALSCLLCILQIRRSMIDGNDGQRFIKTLIKSLDEVTLQGRGGPSRNYCRAERPATVAGSEGLCLVLESCVTTPAGSWHCRGLIGSLCPAAIHRRGVQDVHVGPHQKHQLQVRSAAGTPTLVQH